jgi:parvulin-like peptidyl-prolyl isomerase
VLQVENITVSYSAMKRRMTYEFVSNTSYQTQNGIQILPAGAFQSVLNELTEVTQAEGKLGITLTDAEFDEKFRSRIVVAPAADQRTYADGLRKELDKTGLTQSELERLVRADAIESKIQEKFKAEAPATLLQAKLDVIAAQSEASAQQAIDRINAGEDFATVAKSLPSTEADVQTTGGRHEYGAQGSFNAAYDDYAFSGEVGKLSAPLASGGTFYVVRVVDRSDQPVQESQKPAIANNRLIDWLKATQEELKTTGSLKQDWDEQSQLDALNSIAGDLAAKLAAQQKKQQEDQQKAQDARETAVAALTAGPAASTPAASDATPGPETTPAQDQSASPAAETSPVAPSQPVAPNSNGQ